MATYDHVDFTPRSGVREEAARGLEWRREFNRGGTEVGVARARDLSNGVSISPDTARRMKAYFDRHEIDKQGQGFSPSEQGFPSAGRIAWALWGGDAGQAWANKLVRQLNAADEENRSMIERRSLYEEESGTLPLLRVESRSEDGAGESRWIVGYAAKFGVNSLELDGQFIERIDPKAFGIVAERRGRKKSLETRALWNHDPNYPLARFPGTLRMNVDEIGLRYEFPVPDTTYGRDLASNIEANIVRGSSFSFQIAPGGEAWSVEDGRSIRTVTKIDTLIDVGPVTFPAYPDADVSVAKRSFDAWRSAEAEVRKAEIDRVLRARGKAASLRDFLRQHGR
jgi:HK97 family phage prohead protease